MPPASENPTPPVAPQTPPPAAPPAAPAPVAPTPPPVQPGGVQAPVPAPAKSKVGLIIAIVIGVIVLLGGGYWAYAAFSKTSSNKGGGLGQAKVTPVPTTAPDLNCGAKIAEYPTNPGKAYVQPDNWPTGFQMHDTGDEDSIREFCQGSKLKARAEEFITALSGNDWTKAFGYLTKAEAAATTLAARSNQWSTEYGNYNFPPSAYPLDVTTAKIDYGIETCRKSYEDGWTKTMKSGYYRTPVLNLSGDGYVTTRISLAMSLEDDVWKVVGDSNELHNTSGVTSGDAYSNAQASRKLSSFYSCE